MLLRFSKFLLVLTLMVSIGAHWAVLQSVAWTTMMAANLSTESFHDAVRNTFDGQHPCPLCKAIKSGKTSEQKSEAPAPELKKFEYVNESPRFVFAAPRFFTLLASRAEFPESLSTAPPVPPPRSFFV